MAKGILSSAPHTFYMLSKGYTVPGDQGTHDKLNQIQNPQSTFKENTLMNFVIILIMNYGFVTPKVTVKCHVLYISLI